MFFHQRALTAISRTTLAAGRKCPRTISTGCPTAARRQQDQRDLRLITRLARQVMRAVLTSLHKLTGERPRCLFCTWPMTQEVTVPNCSLHGCVFHAGKLWGSLAFEQNNREACCSCGWPRRLKWVVFLAAANQLSACWCCGNALANLTPISVKKSLIRKKILGQNFGFTSLPCGC